MTRKTGIASARRPLEKGLGLVVLLFVGLLALSGCDQPVLVPSMGPGTAGGIQTTILPYELRVLELDTAGGTVKYGDPILVLPVKFKNVGQDPFVYNPVHSTLQMTEMTTPLLYVAPPNLEEMPPKKKSIIEGIILESGRIEEQIQKSQTLAPGQEVTDYFLFKQPAPSTKTLIFSVPPTLNRGKLPLLFKVNYAAPVVKGPKIYKEGEPIAFGKITFTVDSHEIAYIKTKHSKEGDGFSEEPLLKIKFTIKNDSDNAVGYDPDHRSMGAQGPGLFAGGKSLDRARLQPTVTANGQITRSSTIRVANSLSDYLLYIPPKKDGVLRLEFPGSLFGQQGIARVNLDVKATTPPKPAELTPKVAEEAGDKK